MSAITGIFYRKGKKVDPQLIQKMNDKLSHRGPDGSHTWVEDNVGLGHQMLHTTPESLHEKLPFIEEDLVITADARIDNREELAKKLDIADEETVSDSYFILKAYGRWGEDCPDKLLGDFAFAIWDRKKEILFCARDHMGVKPFYYYVDEEMFVFGSEIKALFEVEGVPREVNEKRLSLYFTGNDLSEIESTFYKKIKSLPFAHYTLLNKNIYRNNKYWELNINKRIIFNSDEDYAKEFQKIFLKAVKSRLRSFNPIGIMLSGGIDSSSVTVMANKILKEENYPHTVHTISYIFEDYPDIDERPFIKTVIEEVDVKPHYIKCDKISPLKNIKKKILIHDQPLSTYNMSMTHESNQLANENGIRIILTGEGGDQVISHGDNYLEELLLTFKLHKFVEQLNYVSKLNSISRSKIIIRVVNHIFNYYYYKLKLLLNFFNSSDILNKKFSKKSKLNQSIKNLELYNIHNEKESHCHFIKQGMQYGFEMFDQDSSQYLVERRHPFFDKRLVEFCLAIPSEIKNKYGFNRYLLRKGMENILPKKIQWRLEKSKMGYVGANNFLSEKRIIEKIIQDKENLIRKYIDLDKLQKALKNSLQNKTAITTIYIWRISLFYFWLKK